MNDNSLVVDVTEEIPFEDRCGILRWRPKWMQRFRSIYLFLATLCIVCILQTAISAGYMSSQITTLERRFSLDSYMLGLIQSFFDVGFISAVVFVGYFGGKGRIPLWIGFGMLIISLGAFIFSLPEFITSFVYNATSEGPSDVCISLIVEPLNSICISKNKANWIVKLFFITGQILIGCGSSPILSLAPTYIDDHVPPTLAPPLIAMLYASSALGPVIGYVLGAIVLQYPVNSVSFQNIKPDDKSWIGAWWIGYILLGFVAVITALFLFLFPRRVRKIENIKKFKIKSLFSKKSHSDIKKYNGNIPTLEPLMDGTQKNEIPNGSSTIQGSSHLASEPSVQISHETVAENYGKNIKDIPKAILGLLTNKIYVVVSLAICFEMFLVNGFAAFLPKYIENEYKVSNITASYIAGGLIVPAGALGIITGGLIMHKFQMSRRIAVLFSIFGVLLVLVCMGFFFLFGCNNPLFAGINKPVYYKGNMYGNISNVCNSEKCSNNCDPNYFSPLCDVDSGVTFFSGCYAGCENYNIDSANKKTFFNCSCTSTGNNLNGSKALQSGECPLKCNSLISFVVCLTLALFLTGVTQNPLLMVTMRSVQKHERSFALGFQFVILRLLAYIPSPIIYGSVIDASCVHWKWDCQERGDCLVTDLKLLNYYLIGLCCTVKCGAAVFYFILYFIVPPHVHNNNIISITSDNDYNPSGDVPVAVVIIGDDPINHALP